MRKMYVVIYEDSDYDFHVKNLLTISETVEDADRLVKLARTQGNIGFIRYMIQLLESDKEFKKFYGKYEAVLELPFNTQADHEVWTSRYDEASNKMMDYVVQKYEIVDSNLYYEIIRAYFDKKEPYNKRLLTDFVPKGVYEWEEVRVA